MSNKTTRGCILVCFIYISIFLMFSSALNAASDDINVVAAKKAESGLAKLLSEATAEAKVKFAASLYVELAVVKKQPTTFLEDQLMETIADYCAEELCFEKPAEKKAFEKFMGKLDKSTRIRKLIRKFNRKFKSKKANFYLALKDFDEFADDLKEQLEKLISDWLEDEDQPHILNRYLPIGVENSEYQAEIEVIGGSAPYTWSLNPDPSVVYGLQSSASGNTVVISGYPESCTEDIKITVTDSNGRSASRELTLHAMTEKAAEGKVKLVFSKLKIKPKAARSGDPVTISYSLVNKGKRTAEPFDLFIYISEDGVVNDEDFPIYVGHVNMLRGGATVKPAKPLTIETTLPENFWKVDEYTVGAMADFTDLPGVKKNLYQQTIDKTEFEITATKIDAWFFSWWAYPYEEYGHFCAPSFYTFSMGKSFHTQSKLTRFKINFGDGKTETKSFTDPAYEFTKHLYHDVGTYYARLKLHNTKGEESPWSQPLEIVMPPFHGTCDHYICDLEYPPAPIGSPYPILSKINFYIGNNSDQWGPPQLPQVYLSYDTFLDSGDYNVTPHNMEYHAPWGTLYWGITLPISGCRIESDLFPLDTKSVPSGLYYIIVDSPSAGDPDLRNNRIVSSTKFIVN